MRAQYFMFNYTQKFPRLKWVHHAISSIQTRLTNRLSPSNIGLARVQIIRYSGYSKRIYLVRDYFFSKSVLSLWKWHRTFSNPLKETLSSLCLHQTHQLLYRNGLRDQNKVVYVYNKHTCNQKTNNNWSKLWRLTLVLRKIKKISYLLL